MDTVGANGEHRTVLHRRKHRLFDLCSGRRLEGAGVVDLTRCLVRSVCGLLRFLPGLLLAGILRWLSRLLLLRLLLAHLGKILTRFLVATTARLFQRDPLHFLKDAFCSRGGGKA